MSRIRTCLTLICGDDDDDDGATLCSLLMVVVKIRSQNGRR
jgi:hypothetical protein